MKIPFTDWPPIIFFGKKSSAAEEATLEQIYFLAYHRSELRLLDSCRPTIIICPHTTALSARDEASLLLPRMRTWRTSLDAQKSRDRPQIAIRRYAHTLRPVVLKQTWSITARQTEKKLIRLIPSFYIACWYSHRYLIHSAMTSLWKKLCFFGYINTIKRVVLLLIEDHSNKYFARPCACFYSVILSTYFWIKTSDHHHISNWFEIWEYCQNAISFFPFFSPAKFQAWIIKI